MFVFPLVIRGRIGNPSYILMQLRVLLRRLFGNRREADRCVASGGVLDPANQITRSFPAVLDRAPVILAAGDIDAIDLQTCFILSPISNDQDQIV